MSEKFGFVFPGQGSQSLGMLADIAKEFSEIHITFEEASDILGYDLWKLAQVGPLVELDKTVHTQPILLAASFAIWRILEKAQVKPIVMAGHSLGEYSALVCSKAISFKKGIELVAARGQYMQEAVPAGKGGLAAIVGLEDADIVDICKKSVVADEVLAPANYNCPGQVVIAGHILAVERALVLAKESGARLAKLLPVSVPSHCILMKPAAEKLAVLLENMPISTPVYPVLNNVDVKIYQNEEDIRHGLVKQLYMPVRWVEIMQSLVQLGITQLIECGPGKVLSGLSKRMFSNVQLTNTADLVSLQTTLQTLSENQKSN